jgi:hypothetical protein
MCNWVYIPVNSIVIELAGQTKLSLTLIWGLTYCFAVFLELETTVLMATVPATQAWFSDQSETFKKNLPKLEPYLCCFIASDILTSRVLYRIFRRGGNISCYHRVRKHAYTRGVWGACPPEENFEFYNFWGCFWWLLTPYSFWFISAYYQGLIDS